MSPSQPVVIVGAGLAGAKAAETMRTDGYDGPIMLIGQEPHRPYERPGLSKALLRGERDLESISVHDPEFYAAHDIELRTGIRVAAIHAGAATVETESGETIAYGQLLLATGSRPRRLRIPGAELDGIHLLRTIDDATTLHGAIAAAEHVAIVGGGWIGSEVAASARQLGKEVTLIDPMSVPLQRAMGIEVGSIYRDLHDEHGVDLRPATTVESFTGNDTVSMVHTSTGDIAADVVVVGVGATPRLELAESAGLTLDNGISVDEFLRTSNSRIFAAGDIASAWNPTLGTRLRVEHWSNALNQGIAAGHTMAGTPTSYGRLPYFFSDQYDLGMEYTGHAPHWDQVVFRGDLSEREFIAFWLDDGTIVAAMNANIWDVTDSLTSLVHSRASIPADVLADNTTSLDSLLEGSDA